MSAETSTHRHDLANLIERQGALLSTGSDQQDWFRAREIADAILASDWLAAREAEVRRATGEQIAQAIAGLGPTWPRGMYGCPDDMFTRRSLLNAVHIARGVTR